MYIYIHICIHIYMYNIYMYIYIYIYIYIQTNVLCHGTAIRFTCILCFSRAGFFRLSAFPSYTWAHIKCPRILCMCTRVYTNTPTHHFNTRKNREFYKPETLSLPLKKHSMQEGKKIPLPVPSHTRMQVFKNTCDTLRHTHVVERLDSTNKQNTPTWVHMHTHTRVYIHVYAYIYTHTRTYIYIHIHVHIYTHSCTHIYTCMYMHTYTQIENLSNDASTRESMS